MKAVILAGGRGTRGRPFTDYIPKAMIPVNGRPLVYHIAKYLSKFDIIDEIIILGNFTGIGKQIEKYFENHISFKKTIKFIQDSQSGTGGDLVHLRSALGESKEFLLWFVDNLCPVDISKMYQFHKDSKTQATIAVRRYRKEETGFAIVKNGIIHEFKEKPIIELQMAECLGIYIINSRIINTIKTKRQQKKDLNLSYDILQPLSKRGKIAAYDIGKIQWLDIDSPTRVERNKELVNSIIKRLG
ncbi:MAG: nucleotidyltransferase family protein [Thaumarchaeota archaeon]|nr:nucleotidyltransferase family protein [Nitrososphaerota archaeon]MDE1831277.1 nucleotidyltransferase family protein [Nitrososphaerota archaeon]MDE1840519.1 nucleotidyltransferase family protein [Nitrososphaerota archaeon]MDE1877331.1 nucleotidyltransferase family protein [Nitrososphaerota archaeon]